MTRGQQSLLFLVGILCALVMAYQFVHGAKGDLLPLLWLVPLTAIYTALSVSDEEAAG